MSDTENFYPGAISEDGTLLAAVRDISNPNEKNAFDEIMLLRIGTESRKKTTFSDKMGRDRFLAFSKDNSFLYTHADRQGLNSVKIDVKSGAYKINYPLRQEMLDDSSKPTINLSSGWFYSLIARFTGYVRTN